MHIGMEERIEHLEVQLEHLEVQLELEKAIRRKKEELNK